MCEYYGKLLKERGIKSVQVSKATGIPQSTLSDWKTGRLKLTGDKVYQVARFFDVPMENFYTNEDTVKCLV